jgi:hypothetical protein
MNKVGEKIDNWQILLFFQPKNIYVYIYGTVILASISPIFLLQIYFKKRFLSIYFSQMHTVNTHTYQVLTAALQCKSRP